MGDAKKLKPLIAKRTVEVAKIDDLLQFAEDALPDKALHNNLKCRCKNLDSMLDSFNEINDNIVMLVAGQDNADLSSHIEILKDFRNKYYRIQSIYTEIFEQNDNVKVENVDSNYRQSNVKLPKMEIPVFDGNFKNWQTFKDMYDALIHSNSSLSNIEKFNYLVSFLRGTPQALVKCTPMTNENYPIAYETLTERYNNKRLIATTHWNSLKNTKKISSSENSSNLRNLLDAFKENVSVLKNVGYPVEQWDFVLFNMLFDRLDHVTATRFELECGSELENNLHNTYEILISFLNKQCIALDTVSNATYSSSDKHKHSSSSQNSHLKARSTSSYVTSSYNKQKLTCQVCNKDHLIYSCPTFIAQTPKERFTLIKNKKWCSNCLGTKHSSANCSSQKTCHTCAQRHHSLLHFGSSETSRSNDKDAQLNPTSTAPQQTSDNSVSTNLLSELKDTVLLATALIHVQDKRGTYQIARAVLDTASQSSFISKKCVNRLGLGSLRYPLSVDIGGIGQTTTNASHGITCSVKPIGVENPTYTLDFVILPHICGDLPYGSIPKEKFSKFSNLKLADPRFNIAGPIDILLGADIVGALLKGNTISFSENEPVAVETVFGYVVMGKINNRPNVTSRLVTTSFFTSCDISLENCIKRLWELEEIPEVPRLSEDDKLAEKIYNDTVCTTSEGRYIVALPFKGTEPTFEGSRDIALRRFFNLEKRLQSNPALYKEYCDFMREYLALGHMSLISDTTPTPHSYYIPHHCVFRPESTSTRLRVVLDASAKDKRGQSLNDTLLPGPKLQKDINSILLRFRMHKVVFTADIKQMFRQILIKDSHTDYQRIVWRFSPADPIQDYKLLTVSFGISSSPYLAIRTILKHANDNRDKFPEASKILKEDIYVDDVVSGCEDLSSALQLRDDLISLLSSAGFELRKWSSNNPTFLADLPPAVCQTNSYSLDLDTDPTIKILGLQWNPNSDEFSYNVLSRDKPCTKRILLSELARIFDPLGYLVPVTLKLKLIIQDLWRSGIDWDSSPPQEMVNIWTQFRTQFPYLSCLKIPRHIRTSNNADIQLHGFCDASEKAYAAVAYFRVRYGNSIKTYLVCAKSKVAPLKKLSIPRLELCAALLLSKLLGYLNSLFADKINISRTFAWSDATIVLCWIKNEPWKYKTFVCNRVTKIQELVPSSHWHHITTEENPADPASRGVMPADLCNNEKWWAGPGFLSLPVYKWPAESLVDVDTSEELCKVALITESDVHSNFIISLLNKFSTLPKVLRIVAYVLRFVHIVKTNSTPKYSHISNHELEDALLMIIRAVQAEAFRKEISQLQREVLPKNMCKLSPFLGEDNIIRVGGRLHHSKLPFDSRHPILLPSRHKFTQLLIEHTHRIYLHPGVQTLKYILSQRYWIVSANRSIRSILNKCLNCFKVKPSHSQPTMGDLPLPRISQVKPFSEVGVDYGGPFNITMYKTRGSKTFKAYICLFVCMATKALHLELVSELSTEAFLAALRRFIARRGRCNNIYSDQGTNFVGASRELAKMFSSAAHHLQIQFHFNPPHAPNFGGLWEAGIKTVKTHLNRVVGNQILTYEEFCTVLCQIEAVCNSRPLCAQSTDPNDLTVLTPGHFLTLEPLNAPPDYDVTHLNINRLSRWQLLQRLHQDFWRRWHREYLHTLMQRSKWTNPSNPITINSIVLIKDDNLPPLKWSLGRVIAVHPGKDEIIRVVTLKTAKGILKRPVNKICALPFHN